MSISMRRRLMVSGIAGLLLLGGGIAYAAAAPSVPVTCDYTDNVLTCPIPPQPAVTVTSTVTAAPTTVTAPPSTVTVTSTVTSSTSTSATSTTTTPPPSQAACTLSGATGATRTTSFPATGATPDNSTDDTSAIQSAINAAGSAGGGVVSLPAGTFVINGHLTMKPGVKLTGAGPTTILKAGPNFLSSQAFGGYPVVSTGGADNVTIANLTADQSGDTLNGNRSGRLSAYLIDVRNSSNAVVDGVSTINPFTYSITAVGSDEFCIKNSTTTTRTVGRYDQLDGIHILNSSNGDVVGNTVRQGAGGTNGDGDDAVALHTYGGTVSDIRVADNSIQGGRHGSGLQFALTEGSDRIFNITITGNTFRDNRNVGGTHTGFYGSSADQATINNVTISGNQYIDNDNFAVRMTGRVTNTKVINNNACRSGGFTLVSGTGNQISGNTNIC